MGGRKKEIGTGRDGTWTAVIPLTTSTFTSILFRLPLSFSRRLLFRLHFSQLTKGTFNYCFIYPAQCFFSSSFSSAAATRCLCLCEQQAVIRNLINAYSQQEKKGDLTRPKRNAKSKNQNRNENKIIVHFDFRARSFSNQSRIQRPVVFVSLLNIRLSSRSVSRCAALRCVAVTSSARVGRNGNGERARASRRCRCRCRCGRRTVAQCEFFIDKIKCIIISTN